MRKTILIIEDETPLLNALKDKFKIEDFKAIGAEDGAEGLKVALQERPDLIILDLLMPVKGGMDMLDELRNSGNWGENVPVIILTNLSPDDKILEGVVKGHPSYYFEKSNTSLSEVVEKAKELLEGKVV